MKGSSNMPRQQPTSPPALKVQFADVYLAARTQGTYPAAVTTWAALSPANTKMLTDLSDLGFGIGVLPQNPTLCQIVVDAVNRS